MEGKGSIRPYLLQPPAWDGHKLLWYMNLPWHIKSTGFRAARGLVRCKTERGDQGDRDDVLTSVGHGQEQSELRRWRRRTTRSAAHAAHGVTALKCSSGDGKWLRRCGSASWSSGRCRLAPAELHTGDSGSGPATAPCGSGGGIV
jgi:hypothetical protein